MSQEKFARLLGDEQAQEASVSREGIQAFLPGLSLSKILGDVGNELGHQAQAGAHELAAALLRGHDGFVMYPRDGADHGPHGPPDQQQEQERGGREM